MISEHFDGRCYSCGVDLTLTLLPSAHFHHPHSELKTSTWHIMRNRKYNDILQWVVKDKVIPVCANCHIKQQSKINKLFEDLIMKRDLFQNTAEEIENSIYSSISLNPKTRHLNGDKKSKLKSLIKQWIRKRYVVEQLTDGVCIGCGITNIYDNLPAFVINHLDPSKKQS